MSGVLGACGGGSWSISVGALTVFGRDRLVAADTTRLNGTAFLLRGATCSVQTGPFAPPGCTCDVGPFAIGQWTNLASGVAGPLQLGVLASTACLPLETTWATPVIALAPGLNRIELFLTDGTTRAATTVDLWRD